jgi:hypothetical protein
VILHVSKVLLLRVTFMLGDTYYMLFHVAFHFARYDSMVGDNYDMSFHVPLFLFYYYKIDQEVLHMSSYQCNRRC